MRSILEGQFERAETILREHRDGLEACAKLLLKYERVTGEQFVAVLEGQDMDTVMAKPEPEQPSEPAQSEQAPEPNEATEE